MIDTSLPSAASRSEMPSPTWPAPQTITRMFTDSYVDPKTPSSLGLNNTQST